MKRNHLCVLFSFALMVLLSTFSLQAVATTQTTAFTYQGQLNAGGVLPSGQTYQFTFTLYDAATGGAVVGPPIQQVLLVGAGGLFTTDLDFGQRFDGQQRWLEIKVGTTIANQQVLSARQPINAVPVAQYALHSAAREFADFFALMPPDNATTVGFGMDVSFPQDGPSSGTIVRVTPSSFVLPSIGTYQVMFQVSVDEPAQLEIWLDTGAGFIGLPDTVVGRASGSSQIMGIAMVTTTVANSVLSVRNVGGFSSLNITPQAGGINPVSAHLVITRVD